MKQLEAEGVAHIRPRDVIKHCGYPANSKEAGGISKTMQRMKNDYELIAGFKYGTYRLSVEDINSINAEQTDIEMKKKFSCL